MLTPNVRYKELKNTYLFNTIYRKTSDYLDFIAKPVIILMRILINRF